MEKWGAGSSFRGTPRFQVLRQIGAGGMGVVYEALDRERNLRVALKILRSLSADAVPRFKHEFRALQDLGHPNLVGLGELHEHDGHWFFTMELLEGTDLLSWLRPGTRPGEEDDTVPAAAGPTGFDEPRLRAALAQLSAGLEALHAAGKVHRDIKPSNVRVTPEGRVVLLDFGLVTDVAEEDSSDGGQVVGTTQYMAPEQAASLRVGPEADWYALGVVLYEALTGQLPFSGEPLQVLMDKQRGEPLPPRSIVDGAPVDLDGLCMRLLAFDPRTRASGRDVLRCLAGEADAASPPRAAGSSHSGSPSTSSPQGAAFVGRGDELALLDAAFEETRRGRVATVVIRGASGVGKSALVRQFTLALKARWPQAMVLAGRCYERESVPYKAFDGAMDVLSRRLRRMDPIDGALLVGHEGGLVARLFPELSRVPAVRRATPPLQEIPNPQEQRNRAFAALRVIFGRLARTTPLVLAIDDFQWADADSAALLSELLRRPDAPPLLLLVTTRPAAVRGLPDDARYVELGGLPAAEAQALVTLLAGRYAASASADAAALAREAEGHPMFLHELVQHLAFVGAPAAGVARLEDALLARIGRLEPTPRRLLAALAVAGAPIPLHVAAQAAGLAPAEAARASSVLRVAMLTRSSGASADDRVEAYHDRIREAVVADLDDAARRGLHAQLADALEGGDPRLQDPQALLRHLEASGQAERAAGQAERAGLLATQALAFDQAAGCYRTALRLGRHGDEARRALQVQLGDALANAGRCADAAEAFFAAAEGAETASRLEYRRRAAEQLLLSGHVDRGLAELRSVLTEIDLAVPATPRRALLALFWQRARLRVRGLGWTPRDGSQISRQDLERLEVHRAVSQGLSFVDTVRGFGFHARGLMLALESGERLHVARSLVVEAVFHASEGPRKLARAEKLLGEGRRIAAGLNDPYLDAYVITSSGIVVYFAGRFVEALRQISIGEELLRDRTTGTTWELNHARIFLLHSYRHMGRFGALGMRLDGYLEDALRRGDRFAATTMARAFNGTWLARDDLARASRELAERAWSPPETGFLHLQHWYELKAHVDLELYQGVPVRRAAEIDTVRRSLLQRVQVVRCDFSWMLGRIALAASPPDPRTAAHIAAGLEREGTPYASAWAALLRAGLASLARDPERTAVLLGEAVRIAEASDVPLNAAVARRRLGELRGGDEGRALIAEGDAWMASEGIVRPDRMTELVAPGFR